MSGSKYFVYGERWRELDASSGFVAGWSRKVRFVYLRRGRLRVAKRRRVLAALQAYADSRPSAISLGSRLSVFSNELFGHHSHKKRQYSVLPAPSVQAAYLQPAAGVQPAYLQPSPSVQPAQLQPAPNVQPAYLQHAPCAPPTNCVQAVHQCCAHCRGCNNNCLTHHGCCDDIPRGTTIAPQDTIANTIEVPITKPNNDKSDEIVHNNSQGSKFVSLLQEQTVTNNKSKKNLERDSNGKFKSTKKKNHEVKNNVKTKEKERKRMKDNDDDDSDDDGNNLCKELTIPDSDVRALRSYVARTRREALVRFDADNEYKLALFYAINPLVYVERCSKTERAIRDRHPMALAPFAARLGLTPSPNPGAEVNTNRKLRAQARQEKLNNSISTSIKNTHTKVPNNSDSEDDVFQNSRRIKRRSLRSIQNKENNKQISAVSNSIIEKNNVKEVTKNKPRHNNRKDTETESSSEDSENSKPNNDKDVNKNKPQYNKRNRQDTETESSSEDYKNSKQNNDKDVAKNKPQYNKRSRKDTETESSSEDSESSKQNHFKKVTKNKPRHNKRNRKDTETESSSEDSESSKQNNFKKVTKNKPQYNKHNRKDIETESSTEDSKSSTKNNVKEVTKNKPRHYKRNRKDTETESSSENAESSNKYENKLNSFRKSTLILVKQKVHESNTDNTSGTDEKSNKNNNRDSDSDSASEKENRHLRKTNINEKRLRQNSSSDTSDSDEKKLRKKPKIQRQTDKENLNNHQIKENKGQAKSESQESDSDYFVKNHSMRSPHSRTLRRNLPQRTQLISTKQSNENTNKIHENAKKSNRNESNLQKFTKRNENSTNVVDKIKESSKKKIVNTQESNTTDSERADKRVERNTAKEKRVLSRKISAENGTGTAFSKKKIVEERSKNSPKPMELRRNETEIENSGKDVKTSSDDKQINSKTAKRILRHAENNFKISGTGEKIHIISKRSGINEYSNLEDHAIVAWVSSGGRARRVNGNKLWKELLEQYPKLTGINRSWHSLRNRYLRYILPSLGALGLPPSDVSRLRAAAATGELKSKRMSANRRNSMFKEKIVRTAYRPRRPPPTPAAGHSVGNKLDTPEKQVQDYERTKSKSKQVGRSTRSSVRSPERPQHKDGNRNSSETPRQNQVGGRRSLRSLTAITPSFSTAPGTTATTSTPTSPPFSPEPKSKMRKLFNPNKVH